MHITDPRDPSAPADQSQIPNPGEIQYQSAKGCLMLTIAIALFLALIVALILIFGEQTA